MAMMPNRSKYRKVHRGRIRGRATRCNSVAFGDWGLQSLDGGWISGRQIEAGRVAANRATGGQGKLWIRIFPHKPISSKPAEPGTVLFEIGGVPEDKAKLAFKRVAHKLPIKVKMIHRLPTT